MNLSKIEHLIVKYLSNEATSKDLDTLSKWIENPENEKLFYAYVKIHYLVTTAMSKADKERIKTHLRKRMKRDKNPFRRRKTTLLKYAAAAILLVGIAYFYETTTSADPIPRKVVENDILTPNNEAITIQLEDGSLKTITSEGHTEIRDANGNLIGSQHNNKVTYSHAPNLEALVYNTIHIPHGKRFELVLSDGTHVYLNAGTSLKYPIKFIQGKSRDVFLTGEAYFNVSEDKKHPFIVHANKMNVEVLGTKFNISDYSENTNINTVLVEGSVALYNDTKNANKNKVPTILQPGYKAAWNKSAQSIEIANVDTRIYTAWIDGKLIFRNTTFKEIRKRLERHFNIRITNQNEELDAQLFDATFDIETIEEILETFSKSYAIQYKIVHNEVLIN